MTGYSLAGGAADETVYTAESLSRLTIAQIREVAAGRGYTLTATLKADIIAEFLSWQEGTA